MYRIQCELFFFFWAGLGDPIACSLFSGGIPYQNSGYKVTRLCPYIMLVFYFVPPPSFPYRRHSRGINSSSPIVSSTSDSTAAVLLFYPSKSRPACYHHCRDILAPVLRADRSQRSRIGCVTIYCTTVFCLLVGEEHRSIGGSIIIRLYNGAFFGLIYSLLVFS